MYAIDSWEFEYEGQKFRAELFHDEDMGAPWDEHDGHGTVSDWTSRDKAPGEMVLAQDRQLKRYYDFREAVRIAKRDGWNAQPYRDNETPGQRAAKAALADFRYLQDWCEDRWMWVYLKVTAWCPCCKGYSGDDTSVGGYESTSGEEFFRKEAENLAAELISESEPLAA